MPELAYLSVTLCLTLSFLYVLFSSGVAPTYELAWPGTEMNETSDTGNKNSSALEAHHTRLS